jgi:hypothetical protein
MGTRTAAWAKDVSRGFPVPVSAQLKGAARIRLVILGVTVPGNQPLKLRVTTRKSDGQEVFLGSIGIVALAPSEKRPRSLPPLRLDVTRTLQRFLDSQAAATELKLIITPVDGRNRPLPQLEWSVDGVRLEVPR